MRTLITTMLILAFGLSAYAKDWTIELSPSQLKMCSSEKLQRPNYFVETCGAKNMVNLSFFTSKTFIPPYKDERVTNLRNPKDWPFFSIEKDGFPFIYDGEELNDANISLLRDEAKFVCSGYPILIREGKKTKIGKSFFSRRKCPRTALGIHPNGSVIIYVTTRATLRDVQEHLMSLGCTDAINFDGGSSTFLYLEGKKIYSSNQGRSYPNVLYWN